MLMSTAAGIGPRGRSELAVVLGGGQRFVRPADVASKLGVDPQTAVKKLARWAADGWLRRARRGLYIPVPVDAANPASWSEDALVVATAVWSPCYFTGWTAANYWSLSEQLFRTTVLKTTKRVRASAVVLLDHEYLVRHTSDAAMTWGLKTEWQREIRLRFADPARTVIDILDEPRLGGGIRHGAEILGAYLNDHDPAPIIEYGDRLGNRAVFKRLGYLLEALERDEPSLISACRSRLSEGISPLDPDGPPNGTRVTRWRLAVNAQVRPDAPA
jgi:predicted transcriptional regulator of viral defense system